MEIESAQQVGYEIVCACHEQPGAGEGRMPAGTRPNALYYTLPQPVNTKKTLEKSSVFNDVQNLMHQKSNLIPCAKGSASE